jgi:O-antigen ligase
MIFEQEFFFGSHSRFNLGWASPNYAGAFLASLLPAIWFAYDLVRLKPAFPRATIWLLEAAVWMLISLTYSRGALFAAVTAGIYWHWLRRVEWDGRALLLRLAIAVTGVMASGFHGRMLGGYVASDGSVLNRITLWRGGLEMLGAAPLGGWTPGSSGRQFSEWFQPVERSEAYLNLVNGILQLGVEWGRRRLDSPLFAAEGCSCFRFVPGRRPGAQSRRRPGPRWWRGSLGIALRPWVRNRGFGLCQGAQSC